MKRIKTSQRMIFQPAYSSSELAGGWSLFQQLRVQGGRPPWTGRLPSPGVFTHTHTHSAWDHLDTPFHLVCTALGCGRKPGVPGESPHTRGENRQTGQPSGKISLHGGPLGMSQKGTIMRQLPAFKWRLQAGREKCHRSGDHRHLGHFFM